MSMIPLSNQYSPDEREFLSDLLQREIFSAFYEAAVHRKATSDLTQSDLARRIGADKARVSKLLRNHGNWTIETISDLANALDLRVEFALSDTVEPTQVFTATGVGYRWPSTPTNPPFQDPPSVNWAAPVQVAANIANLPNFRTHVKLEWATNEPSRSLPPASQARVLEGPNAPTQLADSRCV